MSLADIASVAAVVISTINLWKVTRKKQFKNVSTELTLTREYLEVKIKEINDNLNSFKDIAETMGAIQDEVFYLESMKETLDQMRISLIEIKERIHFQSFLKEAAMVRPMPQLQIPVETSKKSNRSSGAEKAWETRRANANKETLGQKHLNLMRKKENGEG